MRPISLTFSLAASSANNISLSQTPGAAGNLTINGAAAASGVATLDNPRQVGITSAGNDSGRTFTITGTNPSGIVITEAVTGANVGVATSIGNFKTITQIAVDAATAGALTVGTTGVGASQWIPVDYLQDPFSLGYFCQVTGTVNYTIQYTQDEVFMQNSSNSSSGAYTEPVAFADTVVRAVAASAQGVCSFPVRAVRVQINSGTGSVKSTFVQGNRA